MKKYLSILLAAMLFTSSLNVAFAEQILTVDSEEADCEEFSETVGSAKLQLLIAGDLPDEEYILDEDEIPALGACRGVEQVYSLVNDLLDDNAEIIEEGAKSATGSALSIDVSNLSISESDISELSKVISSAINERTDIFYLENSFEYELKDGIVSNVNLVYQDEWIMDDGALNVKALGAAVSTAAEGMEMIMGDVSDEMSPLEKAFAVHERMVEEVDYDMYNFSRGKIPSADYTANGVFTNRMGVCQGYSEAYKAMMTKLGIECKIVSSRQVNHAWNLIKIDGEWYHVDVTWDDPYTYYDSNYNDNHRYDYFLRSDEEFVEHGTDWKGTVPAAKTSTKDKNYVFRLYDIPFADSYMVYKDGYWNSAIYDYMNDEKYILKVKFDGTEESKTPIKMANNYMRSSFDVGKIIGDKVYFTETVDFTDEGVILDLFCYNRIDGKKISDVVLHTANKTVIGMSIKNGILNYTEEDSSTNPPTLKRIALDAQIERVKFAKSTVTLYDAEPYDLGLTVEPASLKVALDSSNTDVATVDQNGIVTPIANGSTVITASGEGISATCKVTVSMLSESETEPEEGFDPEKNVEIQVVDGTYKTLGQIPLPEDLSEKYVWLYPDTPLKTYQGTTSGFEYVLKPKYRKGDKNYEKHVAYVTINYISGKEPKPVKGKVSATTKTSAPSLVAVSKAVDVTVDGNGTYKAAFYLHEKLGNSISALYCKVSSKSDNIGYSGMTYSPGTGRVEFSFKNPPVGKVSVEVTGTVNGTETKPVKLTINFKAPVMKKPSAGKDIAVTTKTVGTIDLLSRKDTPVICTVKNPSLAKVVGVELTGQDSVRFVISKIDRDNNGEIISYAIVAKDVDLRDKTSYKVDPVYTIEDGGKTKTITGKTLSIKTTQSTTKLNIRSFGNVIDNTNKYLLVNVDKPANCELSGTARIKEAPDFSVDVAKLEGNLVITVNPSSTNKLEPGSYTLEGVAVIDKAGVNTSKNSFSFKFKYVE